MQTRICKVISQTEPVYITRKSGDGQLAKCYIRLRELGGDFSDEYLCALLGNIALNKYAVGKTVLASLRFTTHEANGSFYQDIVANEIKTID